MAEDALGVVDVLVAAGVAGAAPVVSNRSPTLGDLVTSGAGAALSVGGVSVDARPPSSSSVARGGAVRMVVVAELGPGVVWLVFLFFLFFFSSFFSSASVERKGR
jgi:hypothetical protein